ncbi:MAG TPA: ABC transporter permease [Thermomicrobiales bacterium]|jgi:ABC-2 type transport system permease protein|nr:ABC transporter permease [Thermomicrobiales bacterium]
MTNSLTLPLLLHNSWSMTMRHLRALARQPAYIVITLVQPIVWLLLFGALFRKVVEIPGFAAGSYLEFLTPGVVVMTALFTNGWSGMTIIEDLDAGIMDRFLVTPTRRGALMNGLLVQQAVIDVVQSLLIVGLALIAGARFDGGVVGVLVLITAATLLGLSFSSFSNALSLVLRTRESVIGIVQFVTLPATFLSAAVMQPDLAPGWIQTIARYNPVNWAVVAGREALSTNPDWSFVLIRMVGLVALAIICASLSTWSFRAYQRSI